MAAGWSATPSGNGLMDGNCAASLNFLLREVRLFRVICGECYKQIFFDFPWGISDALPNSFIS